jgi:chorismate mutase / prephenate dehydratase
MLADAVCVREVIRPLECCSGRGHGATLAVTRGGRATTLKCSRIMSDKKREIEELRRQIATIDAQLLVGLDKRAKAAKALGAHLEPDQPPPLSLHDRPQIESLVARSTGDMPPESLRSIFRQIYAACFGLQSPIVVAYLGPEGGAGFSVARAHFGASASLVVCETARAALEEVSRQRAAFAVLPYETTADGPVVSTISALTMSELRIGLVLDTSPSLHLFSRTGNVKDVEKIYATPGDRALAERSLAAIAHFSILDVKTPFLACQLAGEDHGAGALASEATGAQMGLEVAYKNVLDRGHDRVRYAIVGPRPSSRSGEDSTAIVFSLADSPGALLDVLRQFAERGINLSKIQSRPVESESWAYLFFLEVVGHTTDRQLVSAFEEVKRLTKFFRVLGSYPARG